MYRDRRDRGFLGHVREEERQRVMRCTARGRQRQGFLRWKKRKETNMRFEREREKKNRKTGDL
jgi:hypothetical protein